VAYLRKCFLWQSTNYVGRYFPDINGFNLFYELNFSQELNLFHFCRHTQHTHTHTHTHKHHTLFYNQRNTPTHLQYTGNFPQLWSTTGDTLESISHCVIYKTTTNGFRLLFGVPIRSSPIQATVDITHNAKCKDSYWGGVGIY